MNNMVLNEEVSYTDLFKPVHNHTLQQVIATTYSLTTNLIFLLALLSDEQHSYELSTDLSLKKVLANHKLRIYYQYNKFYPFNHSSKTLTAVMNQCCEPIKIDSASFHPKILLLVYKHNSNENIFFKLLISSRNLTDTDFLETGILLTLEKRSHSNLDTLSDLVEFINNNIFVHDHKTPVQVYFSHNQNIELYKAMEFDKKHLVATSPGFEKIPFFNENQRNFMLYQNRNSHMKMYCVTSGGKSDVWIGSANCTNRGLGYSKPANSECMVKLIYDEDKSGEFINWLEDNKFEKFLHWDDNLKYSIDENEKELEAFINETKFQCDIQSSGNNDNKYHITFELWNDNIKEYLKKIKIRMMNYGNAQLLNGKLHYENVGCEHVSNMLEIFFKLERGRYICRAIKVDCDMEAIITDVGNIKLNDVFPERIALRSLDHDAEDVNRNSQTANNNATNSSDGEYERLLKWFASGEIDFIKKLETNLEMNREAYADQQKVDTAIKWIDRLLDEGK